MNTSVVSCGIGGAFGYLIAERNNIRKAKGVEKLGVTIKAILTGGGVATIAGFAIEKNSASSIQKFSTPS